MRVRYLALLFTVALLAACSRLEEAVFERGLALERARGDFIAGEVLVDGFPLAYIERPGPGETIVLLHGFASEKDVWLRFAQHLPDHYRIIAFDLPGHGASARRNGVTHDVPYLAATVGSAIDALTDEPVHVGGNSLGGMVALLYAHEHPDRVITLGLFAAAGVDPPQTSEFERLLASGDNPLIVENRADMERVIGLVFAEPPLMPWPVGPVLTRRFIERSEFHHKVWDDIWSRRREITGLLGEVATPVFIIWGEDDQVLHPSSVDVFVRHLPDAEVYLFEGTGHSPMVERAGRAGGLYREFLERHPLRR